jgi:hypothetical protein
MYGEQNFQHAWWAQKIIAYLIVKNEWKRRAETPGQTVGKSEDDILEVGI